MALAKATWSRTPDTWKHEYQFIQNKTLISFNGEYKTLTPIDNEMTKDITWTGEGVLLRSPLINKVEKIEVIK